MMHLDTLLRVAPRLIAAGTSTELVGPPGIGKSAVMYDIAAKMSIETNEPFGLVIHMLSQMDPIDLRGFVFPFKEEDAQGKQVPIAKTTRPAIFPTASSVEVFVKGQLVKDYVGIPPRGMVLCDEFGQCVHDMQKAAAQFILEKRLGEYRLPENWVVWAASNRTQDKSGVIKRLSFVQNRMKSLPIEPDYDAWAKWANKNGVHALGISFAKRYPNLVFTMEVPAEPGPFATPRSLVLCVRDLMAMRDTHHGEVRLPDDEVATEVIQAWLGEKAAVDFINHIRLANDLPDIEDIIRSPDKTPVPERTDSRFIMATMLAHHVGPKTAVPFMTYIQRMSIEMQILFVDTANRRNPMVLAIKEFMQWISKNNQLLLAANAV